jgi:hypothetical protein
MFNNIKLIVIVLLSVLLLTNCKKENKQDNTQNPGELVFAPMDANTEKDGEFDILCDEALTVTHARVELNGNFYYPLTFVLDGKLFTQSIKLNPGAYTINEFSLMDDMGTPDFYDDDMVVKSTPMDGSEYAQYVSNPIDDAVDFNIVAFEKFEFAIDVLCYIPAAYYDFGFVWFDVTEITVREQCFFGDFCIKDVNQYAGSLYNLGGSVMIDEVAIFKIVAYINDDNPVEYYNTYYDDNGGFQYNSPMCIEYADYDNVMDHYVFELWIYVTSGESWDYVKFHTWDFWDAYMIPSGDDGVVDFVLGNCVSTPPDLLLPPWMNLPLGPDFDFTLSNGGNGDNSYWDINITGLPGGYDIWNGDYAGWCADQGTTIGNGLHCMDAISSLYPNSLPDYWLDGGGNTDRKDAICAANWLWNHEGDYAPYSITEMQNALWHLFNDKAVSGKSLDMATDALMHCDYTPLPGGWAAIFFIPCNDVLELQMTFFVVDP